MGLFDKVRVLVGALVHKPFMRKAEKVDLAERAKAPQESDARLDAAALEAPEAGIEDTGRVADLLAEQRRNEAD